MYPKRIEDTELRRNPRTGYYEIRWTERRGDGTYRTRTYSCRTKDQSLAEGVRSAWFLTTASMGGGGGSGRLLDPDMTPVADVCGLYLKNHVDVLGKGNTQRWSLKSVCGLIGSRPVSTVRQDARGYILDRRKAGIKDGTIRRELGALRAALGWAGSEGLFGPDWKVPDLLLTAPSPARTTVLTEREYQDVKDYLAVALLKDQATRIHAFVALALETAARSDAIEKLTWDRVDFGSGLIDFRDPRRDARTNKRRGVVPMSGWLKNWLTAWQDLQSRTRAGKTNYYVLGHSGSTSKAFDKYMGSIGYGHVTRHDMRRTWATLRASWGVSLWQIAGVLGDDIRTVTKNYAHHAPDHLRAAVNATGPVAGSGSQKSP